AQGAARRQLAGRSGRHLRPLPGASRPVFADACRRGAGRRRVMRREQVRDLLHRVADGALDVDAALNALAFEPAESLGFATIDHHRSLRQGFPEVIYCAGKTPEQIVGIAGHIAARGTAVLVTRTPPDAAERLLATLPNAEHNALARTVYAPGLDRPE